MFTADRMKRLGEDIEALQDFVRERVADLMDEDWTLNVMEAAKAGVYVSIFDEWWDEVEDTVISYDDLALADEEWKLYVAEHRAYREDRVFNRNRARADLDREMDIRRLRKLIREYPDEAEVAKILGKESV